MTLIGAGSVTRALTGSLMLGLTLLWLAGVIGSGYVLKRLIDDKSDDELHESAALLLSVIQYDEDLLVTAAMLGDARPPPASALAHERFVYQIRDAAGHVLLRSQNAPSELVAVPLAEGIVDAGDWRVATVADASQRRFVQFADPLAERRDALVKALLWLTVPLAALLAFAAYFVFRASRSLVREVERTAIAVSRQDPRALHLIPLEGVVTEMKPAVEATNRLLGRLGDALEAERSFTYNSAHELRTPIAGALAQAQLLAAMAAGTPLAERSGVLVAALSRLARLAERLLALARAEGTEPLADAWIDLPEIVRLTVDEFRRDPRLDGRRIVARTSPARVRGDFDAAGLAVRNLVENALVHGAGGSEIRVECGTTPAGAFVTVIDDGPGVPAAEIPSLVKRFARGTRAAGSGAGLGLSIVETLARRMGATLALRSPAEGLPRGFEARLAWAAVA